jgi:hypothetical protein
MTDAAAAGASQVATDRIVDEIERTYQDWAVWVASETGRWWAARRRALTRAQQRASCTPYLYADDPMRSGCASPKRRPERRAGGGRSRRSRPAEAVPVVKARHPLAAGRPANVLRPRRAIEGAAWP